MLQAHNWVYTNFKKGEGDGLDFIEMRPYRKMTIHYHVGFRAKPTKAIYLLNLFPACNFRR